MQKLFSFIFMIALFSISLGAYALGLDVSVDDEIRKTYNPSELELKQLPQLPSTAKTTIPTSSSSVKSTSSTKTISTPPSSGLVSNSSSSSKTSNKVKNLSTISSGSVSYDSSTAIKLKKGTKFKVKSLTNISDRNKAGAKMSFKLQESVTQRYITIPAGTIIHGVIVETHQPQKTGNGGLIVVKVESLSYQGVQKSLVGKVTKANSKKIFFNNIKGKRKYISNIPTYARKGKPFYTKMMNTTSKLSQNPVGWILTPFTVVSGVVVYGATIVASPVSAAFSTGEHITVPAGATFELKLTNDAYME